MSFFPEDRMAELRELFFESAQELLQALNDQALEMEKQPADPEIMRGVRRTVHTLKGDSAAVGYHELSELAHELEEVLTPELAAPAGVAVPDTLLAAADVFHAMLQAYRGNMQPPSAERLRQQIRNLLQGPPNNTTAGTGAAFQPKFQWSEYEQVLIIESATPSAAVFNVALGFDPACPVRAAAVHLAQNTLRECGTVLAIRPEDNIPAEEVQRIEAVVSSSHERDWLERKLRIPAVVKELVIQPYAPPIASAMGEEDETGSGRLSDEVLAAAGANNSGSAPTLKTGAEGQERLLRVEASRIDAVLNLVGELIIGKSMLLQGIGDFGRRFPKDPLHARLADSMAYQARVLTDLQKSVMKIRMVPVEQLFRRFPRVVRDAAKASGKQVNLVISGEQTDLDKSILDQLAEPLTHLVRNAVDHGIESPEARAASGKPPEGMLRLNACHRGHEVVIEVTDDGQGIDRGKVLAKAVERGVVNAAEADRMTEAEALELIFHPGFSTADRVTQLSGRGVGMDVVRATLERLKGSVTIQTVANKGTTFQLNVPLTLAIIKALLFRVDDRLYAVPLNSVMEIARTDEAEFHHVDGSEIMRLRDQVLPVVRLSRQCGPRSEEKIFVVVITFSERNFGLAVDSLVGEEELVIKALDDSLVASDLVSGASILGDGTVALVLNVAAVVGRPGHLQPVEAAR